jgi:hypothetical protein
MPNQHAENLRSQEPYAVSDEQGKIMLKAAAEIDNLTQMRDTRDAVIDKQRAELDILTAQLDAWHSQFGTSQLSHAIAEMEKYRNALRRIINFPVHSEPVGSAYAMQEIAGEAVCARETEFCKWVENQDGAWETSCSHIFEFTTDGPIENKAKFCAFCGKPVEPLAFVEKGGE